MNVLLGITVPPQSEESKPKQQVNIVPKPSLEPMVNYFWHECVQRLPNEDCPVCSERLLPQDPAEIARVHHSKQAERIYCGHYYHFKCLEQFLSKPPFEGGKVRLLNCMYYLRFSHV